MLCGCCESGLYLMGVAKRTTSVGVLYDKPHPKEWAWLNIYRRINIRVD